MRSSRIAAITVIASAAIAWFLIHAYGRRSSRATQRGVIKVGFQVGDHAPDFELRSLDGRKVRLSDLRGKPVFLNFWATWCAPCRIEMPWLVGLDERYRAYGLQIVGVSMDDASATPQVGAFVKERNVKYEILYGSSATAEAYGGLRFMPQTLFLDADGKIIRATIGLAGKKDLEQAAERLLAGSGTQGVAAGSCFEDLVMNLSSIPF